MLEIYKCYYYQNNPNFKASLMDAKKEFRKKALLNLRKISKNKIQNKYLDKSINAALKGLILDSTLDSNYKNILIYLPMDIEVNIFKLIFFLKKQRKIRLFAPFVTGNEFKITPFRLPLKKNKFGIYESSNSNFNNFNKIDIAIIPIVGIDASMRRIGFGAGMYDKYYAKLKKYPFNIFVSRELNYSRKIITNNYDIKGDIVISKIR